MCWFWLLVGTALADPPIQPVDAGSTIRATVPSYLLPESAYDNCLANTIALRENEETMGGVAAEVTTELHAIRDVLYSCQVQLDRDGIELGELAVALDVAQRNALKWKGQRNTAIAIAGGAILTGVAVVWTQTRE